MMHGLGATPFTISPDAVVRIIPDVARHLGELEFNARIRGTAIEAETRKDIRISLRESLGESSETISAAGPLGNQEVSSIGKVVSLANVTAVVCVVDPQSGVGCFWQQAVEVLHVELVGGVDRQARSAFFVSAELELAGSDIGVQFEFGVLVVECQIIAGSSLEEVAFACTFVNCVALERKKS